MTEVTLIMSYFNPKRLGFPKVKDASCLMTNAPDVVDDKQLEELSLDVVLPKEEQE